MEGIKVGYYMLTSSWGRRDQMLCRKVEGKIMYFFPRVYEEMVWWYLWAMRGVETF